ncbi:MAG TPA: N-acetylglucosamine-6-phosphate deacetylase [Puia sp.]|jgi:N-acetylglucosamine-6-phosphate deacetylase|nr:N-acetylglucosamine-6-phosphate deacetylase [Puia sp.]
MGYVKIHNGRVLTPEGVIPRGTVLVKGEKIVEVAAGDLAGEAGNEPGLEGAPDVEVIDAGGRYVSPGLIDIHVHGGGGHDFMDGTVEAFVGVAVLHARYGTTAMLPTTLTCPIGKLYQILDVYPEARRANVDGAQFLGLHLEGPYLAMNQRGAQDGRFIRLPLGAEYRSILDRSPDIIRWSAAPELEGALEFGRYLRDRGILVSLAHTDAMYEETLEGFRNGYTLATHFYSGMNGVTRRGVYRYAGAVECAYLTEGMDVEVIADGVHLPAPLLRLAYQIKGAGRTALVTDAMRAAGMPEGESVLGGLDDGLPVIVENGVAKLPDRSAFAGSVATAARLIRTMVGGVGVSLPDAVRMMTATPARMIGVEDRKGSLAVGKDADIILFDDQIEIGLTMIGGRVVYEKL